MRSIIEFHLFFFLNSVFSQHTMMENPRSEEENKIKDITNLFRLKEELNYAAIKDEEEKSYYKLVRSNKFLE